MQYPDKPYINLEIPELRDKILADPNMFFKEHASGAILDEIQRAPELTSYIQAIVDEVQTPGLFILTGSHQLQLQGAISQSLAGRTALLDLLPLSIRELHRQKINLSVDEYLLKGFYPAVYHKALNPTVMYRNYVKTYLERDVRQLVNVHNLDIFRRFIHLTAGRVGGILNMERLASDAGVSHNTLRNWLSILEASYLIHRLPPYFENFGKRVIKSPKLYFSDVGMLSYLLGIETVRQISHDRLRGGLFENLVLLEIMKSRMNRGKEPNVFFYRDNHQNEVDIVIKQADLLIPVEVKSTMTFNSALLKNLLFYKKLVGNRAPVAFLVYGGEEEHQINDCHVINYKNVSKIYELLEGL